MMGLVALVVALVILVFFGLGYVRAPVSVAGGPKTGLVGPETN